MPVMGTLLQQAFLLCVLASSSWAQPVLEDPCNETACSLPECACPTTTIPEGLMAAEIPQMVLVMFDGRLGESAEKMIRRLFDPERKNPNKCPIVSTFFVSNENTDYCSVNRLWAEGHEIGVNGITRHNQDFWQTAELDQWESEISRQIENLGEKAGISVYALEGWRTPHLQPGGDNQFYTLNLEFFFAYDSTLQVPVKKTTDNDTDSYWPFTLDTAYPTAFPCFQWPCPQKPHPGLWELPITPLWDERADIPCNYLNACPTLMENPVDTYNVLHNNFHKHFKGNRSPFIINVVTRWLSENEEAAKGLENFLVDMVKEDDVWILSGSQAIQWARRPRTLGQLDSFTPWGCVARRYKVGCEPSTGRNSSVQLFTGLIPEGNKLLLWQYLILTIAFLLLVQYDRRRK